MHDSIQTKIISIAKIITISIATIAIIVSFILYETSHSSEERVVAITQFAQHPSLDLIRQGILDELKEKGFTGEHHVKIVYENAHGNLATAAQIAHKYIGLNPSILIGITTPSAQALHTAKRGKDIPLVFSAVTDPIGANLVKDLNVTSDNVTGTLDLPPLKQQILLLKKIVPHIKTLGVIYNPGEINSVKQIEKLSAIARMEDIEIIKSTANKSSDVFAATSKLAGQVDAIYLPNDNTVISAVESVVRVANEKKIPTIASDDQSTKHGILMSLANNQYQVGRDTGKIITMILNGEPIHKIHVKISENPQLNFNEQTLKLFGIPAERMLLD